MCIWGPMPCLAQGVSWPQELWSARAYSGNACRWKRGPGCTAVFWPRIYTCRLRVHWCRWYAESEGPGLHRGAPRQTGGVIAVRSTRAQHLTLPHLWKDLLGQHVQLIEDEALWHAGPLHAHDQVIDARGAVEREHLLRHLIRRPQEKAVAD